MLASMDMFAIAASALEAILVTCLLKRSFRSK